MAWHGLGLHQMVGLHGRLLMFFNTALCPLQGCEAVSTLRRLIPHIKLGPSIQEELQHRVNAGMLLPVGDAESA